MVPNEASGVFAEKCPQCGASLPPQGERIVCAYCGSSLVRRVDRKAGEVGGWGLRLRTYSCVDSQGIGMEAFRMLIPADWRVEGGIQWVLNNPGMPAVVALRVYNPDGPEAFPVVGDVKPEYDYAGADAVIRLYAAAARLTRARRASRRSRIWWKASRVCGPCPRSQLRKYAHSAYSAYT